MYRTLDEAVNYAADWWVSKLTNPRFDNGMNDKQGRFASALASVLTKDPTAGQIELFKENFVHLVKKEFSDHNHVRLESDYAAEGLLHEIMEKSGFPYENAPWKTCMFITKRKIADEHKYMIEAKCGYGDRMSEI